MSSTASSSQWAGSVASMSDLNLAAAHVTLDNGDVHDGIAIVVRKGVAKLRTRHGGQILERAGVTAVENGEPGHGWARARGGSKFTVRFDDGTTWTVERRKVRCGSCGGGR